MKRCCVIGGLGFIGTQVIRYLVKNGRKVTVLDVQESPSKPLPEGIRYIAGDFGNRKIIRSILNEVDEVVNLAYTSVPKTSYDDPIDDLLNNVPPSVIFLEAASQVALDKIIIFSSGGTVYGPTKLVPLKECDSTLPISPYGITKLTIENYARMYHLLKKLPVICVRPGNVYGEMQRPFAGQGFIATAIASIMLQKQLHLFGPEGTVRDYIHVEDVASAVVALLENGIPGQIYNIGTGKGRSNRDVLNAIEPYSQKVGLTVKLNIVPPRGFDVPVNILDNSKLKNDTGWAPAIPFEIGLERTWNWMAESFLDQQGSNS